VALRRQSLLAIFQFPFRHARDRFNVWRRPVCGGHERGRALARPVTVRFAGAVPSTIAAMIRATRAAPAGGCNAWQSHRIRCSRFSRRDWGKSRRCIRSARHSPSDILGALAEIEEGRRARRGSGQPARQALFRQPSALRAVRPPTRHITPDAWCDLVHAASARPSGTVEFTPNRVPDRAAF
jgi:hypothetical protein